MAKNAKLNSKLMAKLKNFILKKFKQKCYIYNFSSNTNEVIRPVLNFYFFYF